MNYIPQIAKMLGIEIGERFEISGYGLDKYYLSNDGLFVEDFNGPLKDTLKDTLEKILTGKSKIRKLPWRPEDGEMYYYPSPSAGEAKYDYSRWGNYIADISRYNTGLVCRTREEAMAKAKKMLAAAQGEAKIKKLPWKPKKDGLYYIPCISTGKAVVECQTWVDDKLDELRYNNGLVCRYQEDALKLAEKMIDLAREVNANDD